MAEPVIFQDQDRVYYADTCEPLKAAALRGDVLLHGWARGSYPGLQMPHTLLPGLCSVGVWDATRWQSWGLGLHCNEGIEFTFLARGKTAFEVDGATHVLHKGHLTVTRPWQFHRVGNPNIGASRLIWLIIDVNVRRPNQPWLWPEWLLCSSGELKQLTRLLRHNEQPVWQSNQEIARCFDMLDLLLRESSPAEGATKLTLCINQLIIAFMEMLERKNIPLNEYLSTTHRMVEVFLKELPKHIAYDWDLNAMAKQCGLSRSQFSCYCKQITNMTPIEYLNACRIDSAAELLVEQPKMSVTDVAFACGFNSSQYFATTFHAHKGSTPSRFRDRAAQDHLC